ncbi:hypothetical protein AVEN_223042-1, partial [Araneus ventricosus]
MSPWGKFLRQASGVRPGPPREKNQFYGPGTTRLPPLLSRAKR